MKISALVLCAAVCVFACAQESQQLAVNGTFVGDEDGDGLADGWSFAAGTDL